MAQHDVGHRIHGLCRRGCSSRRAVGVDEDLVQVMRRVRMDGFRIQMSSPSPDPHHSPLSLGPDLHVVGSDPEMLEQIPRFFQEPEARYWLESLDMKNGPFMDHPPQREQP